MADLSHRLRRRRLDTTATKLLREARLRGFTAEPEPKREEWQTLEVHWPARGPPRVKLDGRRVDVDYGLKLGEEHEPVDSFRIGGDDG